MATTVDRFISEFILIDRYSQKLQSISRSTDTFARKLTQVTSATLRLGGAALATAGAGIVAFGVQAVKTSAQFEQFAVTLEVLTGSADRAKQKLDFIKRLAIPSTFTFQELAEAGTQLESFRVPLEKALPLIAKLGAAFPNKELSDFVNLFGRLASGDFPDIEALSGAGLSKLDFIRKGIKFDENGSLLSSSRETMDALEKIINERYGNILDRIAGTTTAKLATVRDKWQENLRKIGDAIIKYVNPALDRLSRWLDKLGQDKNFEKFLKDIAANTIKFVGVVFGILGTLLTVVALLKFALKDVVGGVLATIGAIVSFAGGILSARELAKFFKSLEAGEAGAAGSAQVPATPPGTEFPDNPALATLNDIEKNTKATSDNTRQALDLRKFALGGGDIGALGITPIERFGGRGGRGGGSRSVKVEFTSGMRDKMTAAMAEIAGQVLEDYLRGRQ